LPAQLMHQKVPWTVDLGRVWLEVSDSSRQGFETGGNRTGFRG